MDANEDVPYKLVYGGIMIKDEISFDSITSDAKSAFNI